MAPHPLRPRPPPRAGEEVGGGLWAPGATGQGRWDLALSLGRGGARSPRRGGAGFVGGAGSLGRGGAGSPGRAGPGAPESGPQAVSGRLDAGSAGGERASAGKAQLGEAGGRGAIGTLGRLGSLGWGPAVGCSGAWCRPCAGSGLCTRRLRGGGRWRRVCSAPLSSLRPPLPQVPGARRLPQAPVSRSTRPSLQRLRLGICSHLLPVIQTCLPSAPSAKVGEKPLTAADSH